MSQDQASYGGSTLTLKCPSCGTEIRLLDRKFTKYGPVRCGGCGTDLRDTVARSELGALLRGEPVPRERS